MLYFKIFNFTVFMSVIFKLIFFIKSKVYYHMFLVIYITVDSTIKLHVLRVKAICDKSVTLDQHKTCGKCAVGVRELQTMLSALRGPYFAHS